ncbi:PLP-dependent aminotransferase family protein [Elizabethkingia anophelis]|uniref:aminotransferase-like domain-containing protein n=1 Tax=Elizabethkingia anophelis TaxID=1117645 RepID=UPI0004E2ACB8|nr:PLP-dependent aminotransferase family protein [Elizabethkingia anophelis]KFC35100.1 transcriptional regulator [Elizabethkingia anophelis]MCT3786109.1 PLP-dependent aminotransferase family protein [Elizabethkingia anophelis]MDV3499940.1 PLP-dependent aminotransferase family protein [Elizabethkingia anophelis]MDV3502195.1 PLP-dependent aminotransferase family protein [Elizabethkingia anophelis]
MKNDFLYSSITHKLSAQIKSGVLKEGERLPSVRALCQNHNVSMNTAKRVFLELESQSLIYSVPQSGYFVSQLPYLRLPLPETSKPSPVASSNEPNELINKVFTNIGREDLTLFSIGAPDGELIPLPQLKKEVIQATRTLKGGGTSYESLQGNVTLRRMIAARSLNWGGNLNEDEIITTNGGMNSLSFCLMALTKPGDTIAIESPCYPGILQLAISLRLKVLELPTHPETGLLVDELEKLVSKIDICLLIPNFNTPLGSCMPDENKKAVVQLLSKHNIPIVEDDVYGDLHFGNKRPSCCKAFDTEGNVLWCSSISKTLAAGYRVGWIAPGKYKDQIMKLKLVHSICSNSIINESVGSFLKSGKYEKHLWQLRKTLQENYLNYAQTIAQHFPEGTKISQPKGGLALWVEFSGDINTVELFELAMKKNICIAPGRVFTLQDQYHNCMRLTLGLPWNESLKEKLIEVGNLAKTLIK